MKRDVVDKIVDDLLTKSGNFSSEDFADRMGISRQGAHRHLRRLVDDGFLVIAGRARAARYKRSRAERPLTDKDLHPSLSFSFQREGLEEDRVWRDVEGAMAHLVALSPNARSIFHYAFTELLNNAIDHSNTETIEVMFYVETDMLCFEIRDHGIGALDNIRNALNLPLNWDALVELGKGKLTTAAEHHTGEGIFFSSKVADIFVLESGGLRWTVDNIRFDTAVGSINLSAGTTVRFSAATQKTLTLKDVFDRYTEDFEFTKTQFALKLLTYGTRFISRSEAKRMLNGLEKFTEVTLDFGGVEEVGQGFVDQVFRVWNKAHPHTRLISTRMNEGITFMVNRALNTI